MMLYHSIFVPHKLNKSKIEYKKRSRNTIVIFKIDGVMFAKLYAEDRKNMKALRVVLNTTLNLIPSLKAVK